jgi:PAS domain S-box-containing protein
MRVEISLYILPFILAFIVNLIVSLVVLFHNRRNPTNRILSALMFVLAIWNLGDALFTVSTSDAFSITLAKILCSLATLIPCIYLHFVMEYPSKRDIMNHGAVYFLLYAPAAAFFYLTFFTDKVVGGPLSTPWAKHYYHYGPAIPFYSAFFIVSLLIAILVLISVFIKSPNKRERFQSKWFIIATFIPILGGVSANLILPMAGAVVFPLAGPLTLLTSVLIAYAMLRYRIMSTSLQSASDIIISMLPGIVVYLGTDQRIISGNKRFFELLGYSENELEGQPISSILSEESKRSGLPLQRWEEKTPVKSQLMTFKSKSGEPVTIDFSGTIVTDDINDIIGLVGMGFPVKGSK